MIVGHLDSIYKLLASVHCNIMIRASKYNQLFWIAENTIPGSFQHFYLIAFNKSLNLEL
jgi:hypothetical protein